MNQSKVRELFDYRDGKLFWRVKHSNSVKVGSEAGTVKTSGYRVIVVDGKDYRAHRLVFLYHEGYFPENSLDHIDRGKLNNRIENLREVGHQCNARNTTNPADNTSGVKGVYKHKAIGKWCAEITVNRKKKHLGTFSCKTEAVCHRLAAEQCLNWQECDSSSPAKKYLEKL